MDTLVITAVGPAHRHSKEKLFLCVPFTVTEKNNTTTMGAQCPRCNRVFMQDAINKATKEHT